MRGMIGASAALAGAIASAAPSIAENPQDAGAMCQSVELNKTAVSSDGTGMTLRCLADEKGGFTWMTDTGAVGTIAQLQAEGYTATITSVGDGSLDRCEVIEVRNPITYNRTTHSDPRAGGANTIVIHKTIDVFLDCSER